MKNTVPARLRRVAPVLAILILLSTVATDLAAQGGANPGLQRSRLPNGLEIIVYRDPAVPLAEIRLVFKAGGIAQTADTAGLFHLFEHLVFRGKAETVDSSLRAELAELGSSEWNGTTSAEYVSFKLSLPADKVQGGIAFWARVMGDRSPIDPAALESEKAIVLEELQAKAADPDRIYEAAMTKRLFSKFPWRRDPAGSIPVVSAATPQTMAKLRDAWFVPNNAALIVGGDVDPEAVLAAAREAFGSWPQANDPWKTPLVPQPRLGVTRPTWLVFPDSSLPEGIGMMEARYRGPDVLADPPGAIGADLWTALVADPAGRFKASMAKNVKKLYGPDPVSAYYVTQRDGALISISSYFFIDPAAPAPDRSRQFKEQARGFEITAMRTDSAYFTAADYEAARRRILDARLLELETAEGYVDALAFWWSSVSIDAFLAYPAAIEKAGSKEVKAFLDQYVLKNLEIVAVRMNPIDYDREKKLFAGAGFEVVGAPNAFWWKK